MYQLQRETLMLRIYNSLTKRKEKFIPIRENKIGIYVCGMTVYDYCHIGHARVMVGFDFVVRYLRFRGYEVTYVRNITDIDDKIIARANELGETVSSLTERYINYMNEDLSSLSILKPDHEPRATEYISQIIVMISTLIDEGYAYRGENGDVYYRSREFADYGKLSGRNLDEMLAGARLEPDHFKEDPLDFVLWKKSKPNEPKWNSPWGEGRPGWHIECSAMSTSLLGNHFDIHGGGRDLLFPHHENEIAQSEAATGESFVNLWMHNGYLQIDSEKMSKSLDNFLTIREVLQRDPNQKRIGEILRYVFLSSHYRSPLNYSDESLQNARMALRRIYMLLQKAESQYRLNDDNIDENLMARFIHSMDDDFNTPEALAVIFDGVREFNRTLESNSIERNTKLRNTLVKALQALGLFSMSPSQFLGTESIGSEEQDIRTKIELRRRARQQRDWGEADKIREQLTALGVEIEDQSDGTTTWRRLGN